MAIDQTSQPSSALAGATVSASTTLPTATASSSGGFSFKTFLSDLNPLQYIPGVGAIYRAITGDEGNPTLRFAASLGTSFALGGPIGVGITIAEKVTGFDPEKIGRHLLAKLFHPSAGPTAASTTQAAQATPITAAAVSARPWTAGELSAYGVRTAQNGELSAGNLTSADVLNTLELHRLSTTYA